MSSKIFRDPLYNYVSIDRKRDGWLLELLDCPEIQRLRRIHQLGVSYLTYPGADHNRLAHSLGVLHLMYQALQHLERFHGDAQVARGREPLLAAALVHDVGHGPFSHLIEFNPPLCPTHETSHEVWSQRIVLDEDCFVNRTLRGLDPSLPRTVANLIDKNNYDQPAWEKYLLSSQLDMDRLDYLRRDSLFTGAGYGHYDWFRILASFELVDDGDSGRDIVWEEKAKMAIEEYIFSRYYMYQNVYLHKTTRGFEKVVEAMWRRAKRLHDDGVDVWLIPTVKRYWTAVPPSIADYLDVEEYSVLHQIQTWTAHPDKALGDLARRFLGRERLAVVEAPAFQGELAPDYTKWEGALRELVQKAGYDPPEAYCLRDNLKGKYNQPYFPEKESDEQSVKNAIRIKVPGEERPVEISELMDRLKPLTQEPVDRVRYYVPKDVQADARKLRSEWKGA